MYIYQKDAKIGHEFDRRLGEVDIWEILERKEKEKCCNYVIVSKIKGKHEKNQTKNQTSFFESTPAS